MWLLYSLLLDDRVRLSRLVAIPSALMGLLFLVDGFVHNDRIWNSIGLGMGLIVFAIVIWKLGDWYKARQNQTASHDVQPGFDVVVRQAPKKDRSCERSSIDWRP